MEIRLSSVEPTVRRGTTVVGRDENSRRRVLDAEA